MEQRIMMAVTGAPLGTYSVWNDGTAVNAGTLDAGKRYVLVASGTVVIEQASGRLNDAEYVDPSPGLARDYNASELDVGIKSNNYALRWGEFRSDHVYEVAVTGTGSQLDLRFVDYPYTDQANSPGYLSVNVYGEDQYVPVTPPSNTGTPTYNTPGSGYNVPTETTETNPCSSCADDGDPVSALSGAPTGTCTPWSGGVMYGLGRATIDYSDFGSNNFGTGWPLGRSFSTEDDFSAGGNNGNGWSDASGLPFVREYLDAGTGNGDVLVFTSGRNARQFKKSGTTYTAGFFNKETLAYDSANGGLYTLTDTTGQKFTFYGFGASIPAAQRGQFQQQTNPAGQVTAKADEFYADGKIKKLLRSDAAAGVTETFTFTYYTSGENAGKLSTVLLERTAGGTTTLRKVAYTYYGSNEVGGSPGDLKKAEVTDAALASLAVSYYRYYKSGEANGYTGGLKYAFGAAAYARLAAAVADPEGAADSAVSAYADHYFEYDSLRRVTKHTVAGEGCSACGGGQGTYTYAYTESAHNQPDQWRHKTVEMLPDGTQIIVYSNRSAQVLLKSTKEAGTGREWVEYWRYDADGRTVLHAKPSAVSGYSESLADLVDYGQAGNYLRDTSGLIEVYEYGTSTASVGSVGDVTGFLKAVKQRNGDGAGAAEVTVEARDYAPVSWGGQTLYLLKHETVFAGTNTADARTTTHDYTQFGATAQVESQTITHPVVSTGHNGLGSATSDVAFYDKYSRVTWEKDADGFINYTEYDPATGAVKKRIVDVDTSRTSEFSGKPAAWSTPAGGGLHLVTSYELDGLGRVTKTTDPRGNVTYIVYKDAYHEVRTYRGWYSYASGTNTLYTTTGPVEITREDRAGNYVETLTLAHTPTTLAVPNGLELISAPAIRSLARSHFNDSGQLWITDDYFSLAGLTYTTDPWWGSPGPNLVQTSYDYEKRGRLARAQGTDGTIRETFYDPQGRVVAQWQGIDDLPDSDLNADGSLDWRDFRYAVLTSGSAPAGTVMFKVGEYVYDGGGVGDGNLTQSRAFYDDTHYYGSDYAYDWRNRLTDQRGPDGVATKYTLDLLGERTAVETYADADADFVIDSGELRGKTTADYDELGQVYRQTTYNVDPATGGITPGSGQTGHALATNTFYNRRGFAVKVIGPNGLFAKYVHDGAGRSVATYTGYDADDTEGGSAYAGAQTVDGDTVIEQVKTIYDKAGNVVMTTSYERLETDSTTTGALGAASNQAFIQVGVRWYDRANRLTDSVNYGRDSGPTYRVFNQYGTLIDSNGTSDGDGVPDVAEGAAPAPDTSDDYIVGKYGYDDGGRLFQTTDNLARQSNTYYDLLGNVIKKIENVQGTNVTVLETDTDLRRTTEYLYDSYHRLWKMRAKNPKGSGAGVQNQDTTYLYESDFDWSLVTSTIYPDSADTTSAGTDQVKTTYDRLGRPLTVTDQRRVVHAFSYDSAGRPSFDGVTLTAGTPATNVSSAVLGIGKTFDSLGRVETVTSYAGTTAASAVVNQVKYTYDGWGNIVKIEQAHDGAVIAGTPATSYTFDDGLPAGSTNTAALYVRLSKVTYPGGRQVFYNYPASGVGSYLNRVDNIAADASGTTKYAQYTYVGANRIVKLSHPVTTNNLTLAYSLGSAGSYSGMDRFGRVTQQLWKDGALSGGNYDGYLYYYDRNGNVLRREYMPSGNNNTFDEQYTYDGLDRLASFKRGTLVGSTISGTNVKFSQDWGNTNGATLDSLGNWRGFQQDADGGGAGTQTTQARTHNAANETGAVTGTGVDWVDPVYDNAGNMTSGPKASTGNPTGTNQAELTRLHYVYDAWNRLVAVKSDSGGSPGATVATYEYDGLNQRVSKTLASTGNTDDYYYNADWQLLETRRNGDADAREQYVWDLSYVDTPVFRVQDTNTDGAADNTLYYLTDANHNVSGVYEPVSGTVQERYLYDPYGRVQIYDRLWARRTQSAYEQDVLFAGYRFDAEDGVYLARNRQTYHPTLGAWGQRDPAGYVEGGNLYEYVESRTLNASDPSGLATRQDPVGKLNPFNQNDAFVSAKDANGSIFRYPKECTVVVTIGHTLAAQWHPVVQNPDRPSTSAHSFLTCYSNYVNCGYDGSKVLPRPGQISGFPTVAGPIGPGGYDANLDWEKLGAGIQLDKRHGKGVGLSNAAGSYNGGNLPGAVGWQKLLTATYQAAINQAKAVMATSNCPCKQVDVYFIYQPRLNIFLVNPAELSWIDDNFIVNGVPCKLANQHFIVDQTGNVTQSLVPPKM